MPKPTSKTTECESTLVAARAFSRRLLLKQAVLGGVMTAAPAVIGAAARAAAGELRVMTWASHLPEALKDSFEAQTGLVLRISTYQSNEELINKMKATRGRGVDLVMPSLRYGKLWQALELLQPWDMSKVPVDRIAAAPLQAAKNYWSWQDGSYLLPYLWGAEGLAWRSDAWTLAEGESLPSYGDLWRPEVKGLIMGRAESLLTGIGLYLDAKEIVPSNRLQDAYEDKQRMSEIFVELVKFALQRKAWVKLFWEDARAQQEAMLQGGITLGQAWDGPMLRLQNAGAPVRYLAPAEGALAWMDGIAIPVGARNFDAIYTFLDGLYRPETSRLLYRLTGYHAAAREAMGLLGEKEQVGFAEAYPADALDRLWWWPAEPAWFPAALKTFRDQLLEG